MKAVLLSLALVAAAAPTVVGAEVPRVFVFTNEVSSASVDKQLQARRESLQDLVKTLSSPRYEGAVTLVKSREGADVIIELVSRGETTTSEASSSTSAAGGATASASRSSTVTKQFLKFRISAGQYTHDLTTEDQFPWTKMADRAAEHLVAWITEHVVSGRR